jgi:hypothetical protein
MIPADLLQQPAHVRALLDYTLSKVGVCEIPLGSNRGPDIDAWADEFQVDRGSYWCGLMVGHCRKYTGVWIPTRHQYDVASCDEWYLQGEQAGLFSKTPVVGAAILYTTWKRIQGGRFDGRWDIHHTGTVLRTTPALHSLEGNTTLGKYDRNGIVLALKEINVPAVLGYILPSRAP